MRNDKHLAIDLRKKGLSYQEISNKLDIPKSTLSNWLSNKEWSQKIKKKLTEKTHLLSQKQIKKLNKAKQKKWKNWREEFREEAKEEFVEFEEKPLFITGLMLYWGEGDSNPKNGLVRLGNTEPEMINIFSRFLQKICKIPKKKLRIGLILYPDLDEKKCKEIWSKATGVPLGQFHKTQFIEGKHPTKRSEYGIGQIIVSSQGLKEKIKTWLDMYSKKLMRE